MSQQICKAEDASYWINRMTLLYDKKLVSVTPLSDGRVLILFEDK